MSDLGFLKKWLDGATVEWIPLGKLGRLVRGNGLPKSDFTEHGVPAIHYGQIYTTYSLFTSSTISFVSRDTAQSLQKVDPGDVVITNTSENFEDVATPLVYFGTEQAVTGGHATIFKPNGSILGMYLAYFMQTPPFAAAKRKYAKGTKVIDVSTTDLAKIHIPIPCPANPEESIAIQAEIIRVLDRLKEITTELTTELATELAGRRKQYNYYRESLMNFAEGCVEWLTLGEVSVRVHSGSTPKAGDAKYYDGGTIPWLRTQEVVFADITETAMKITQKALEETAVKWVPENCVIVAISGATAGRSAVNKIPLTTNQHCCCLEIDPKKAYYRYVFHWVSMNYEKIRGLGQGARGDLNSVIIKGFRIPIPFPNDPAKSLAEQVRIVEILDKFDTLTTSLSVDLPCEIELRNRQYEYYRDLLLSFPKPEEGAEA